MKKRINIVRRFKTVAHLGINDLDALLIKTLFHPSYIDRVHISFDDVYESFKKVVDLKCDSIFEIPFFNNLKKLNKVYGAKFSLYMFEDEKIELNNSIFHELEQCSEWISIGYHARVDGKVESQSFSRFHERFKGHGLISKSCRFHGFSNGDLSVSEIKSSGIHELLCADDGRMSYGVSFKLYGGGTVMTDLSILKLIYGLKNFAFLKFIN